MMKFMVKYQRAFWYSLIFACILFAVEESYARNHTSVFIWLILTGVIIYMFEVLLCYFRARALISQLQLSLHAHYDLMHHLFDHIVLPITFFIGVVIFLVGNNDYTLDILLILSASIIHFVLYTNIHSFYFNQFTLEFSTHVVYDFLKIFLCFLYLFALRIYTGFPFESGYIVASMSGVVVFILLIIQLRRYQELKKRSVMYAILASLMIMIISFGIDPFAGSALSTAVILTVFYYIFAGLLHHKAEGSLTFKIMFEYFIIALMVVVLLINLIF